uniref:WAP domain-containing protein n=1 Tax=Globodera pallida TaxID=36090 RepID=A0A183CNQ8_GLOPA
MHCPRLLPFLLAQLPICIVGFGFENSGASCSSNEYCPGGWSVLRRLNDYSAHTCNPADPARAKCPKPHMCVAAKCGISFCCASDKMLDKLREQQSAERDAREAEEEEREEADRTESGGIEEGTQKDEQRQRKRASDVDL